MIVLDSNVVSELMRADLSPAVKAWFIGEGRETGATTAVTVAEIAFGLERMPAGARRADKEARFAVLVPGVLPVLAVDEAAGRTAGHFQALRQRQGFGVSIPDMLIAGAAASRGAALATRNIGDFAGLPLRLVDPWSA